MRCERRPFFEPEKILAAVQKKIDQAWMVGEPIDYLTFVPDGEPTLDANLGRAIQLLKPIGIKIAIITNTSLIWREDVQATLMGADWVSLKLDSVRENIWRELNRPHGSLNLARILDGMLAFANEYQGELVTETMLVGGVNDRADQVHEIADFVARLKPAKTYLSIPTRPPAEGWATPPSEKLINRAYQILSAKVRRAEYLIGYEGNAFASTGEMEEDLLSITAVHPMRHDAVSQFLRRAGVDWPVVDSLIAQGRLVEVEYEGNRFYLRMPIGLTGIEH
jgi:wyosine [tRNA(Phe)-imidazoG37] synthetase (radical SAM superfamily)